MLYLRVQMGITPLPCRHPLRSAATTAVLLLLPMIPVLALRTGPREEVRERATFLPAMLLWLVLLRQLPSLMLPLATMHQHQPERCILLEILLEMNALMGRMGTLLEKEDIPMAVRCTRDPGVPPHLQPQHMIPEAPGVGTNGGTDFYKFLGHHTNIHISSHSTMNELSCYIATMFCFLYSSLLPSTKARISCQCFSVHFYSSYSYTKSRPYCLQYAVICAVKLCTRIIQSFFWNLCPG